MSTTVWELTEELEELPRQGIGEARHIWREIQRDGNRLLKVGRDWRMVDWVKTNPEWIRLQTSGFFDDFPDILKKLDPEDEAWGQDLKCFLLWRETFGAPFGYAGKDDEFRPDLIESVINDIRRDVRAVQTAASEKLLSNLEVRDAPVLLNTKEQAVLDLITSRKTGITGVEILDELAKLRIHTDQSTLTTRIIPKLRAFFSVTNRPGFGYIRG